ncbi:putative disease resistance protein RGA1 isoform X1 [Silene latifolia]|uniref:putative disease resistance protein RGA1 isoform X1 n=1 Tax=Silene latifolia TaxID=37657 RepID=UPI003D785599
MADLGALISIAENVFKLLQSPVLKNMRDWESDLGKLNKSVSFIKDMLLDVEAKPELSRVEQRWVDELNEVLYEADDLFDEVITIAKQKELNAPGAKFSKKVLDKVSHFFSSKNRILVSYNTSQEVKSIQKKLDAIAKDHARYDFKVDPQATLKRKEDTCSFLNATHENIIGREDDVKAVVDMLLDPNVEENVGFIVVVGIGGLGKTALARLVYNHDRVGTRFEKKLWTCVSDQDGKGLDVQAILGDIIESSTNKKPSDVSTMESMQTKLQEELKNKVYLLILDDVWTEDPNEWSKLSKYLTIGGRGSRVVITTRSEKTAEVVLGKATHSKKYMLQSLSDENSWHLFALTAFERESDEANDPELMTIGKKIVKKCSNVPLAIKVLGTLLYGQTHKWESFEKNRILHIETTKNPIMSILKLSYNNLEPPVKNCFRYCALFPKDFEMDKRELISLWMAQGYIGDSEDCFLILLKRCFFQDVERDDLGDIVSLKMHDLMHDLAQEVAGDEIIVSNSPPNNLRRKLRHLFIDAKEVAISYVHESNIRTCYMNNVRIHSDVVNTLVSNWRCLRSLRLYLPFAGNLPESIGDLLHLRYLDLSRNGKLKTLPKSITKLFNLQSLILEDCWSLKEWPKDFCKLVNLRLLDINSCSGLTCMPLGIDQLTNLRDLTYYNVRKVSPIRKQFGGQLKDLKFLVNLRGRLEIRICGILVSENENKWEGGYLEHIKNLKAISISFNEEARESNNEALIERLQPNRNLMELSLDNYNGTEIPRWGRAHDDWSIILPKLVNIQLDNFKRIHGIPLLSNLKHLKFLTLSRLSNLEYMEHGAISRGCSRSKDVSFFPSLVYLRIDGLTRLKGWWGGVCEGDSSSCMPHWQPPFPRLSKLAIEECPELASLPPCPTLESLHLTRSSKSLRILPGQGPANLDLKLKVYVDSVGYLTNLPARCLADIVIQNDDELKRLQECEEVFKSSYSSLQKLEIIRCKTLTSVSEVSEHLTALEDWAITFPNLVEITLSNCERLDGIPLLSNLKHLKRLTLSKLNNLEYMEISAISRIGSSGSKDIPFFPSLEYLSINGLERLRGWWKEVGEGDSSSCMPHWQPPFPRLSKLLINNCLKLTSLPPCPNLKSLKVKRNNKALRILPGEGPANLDLKFYVEVDSVGYLATLLAFRLTHIKISGDEESKRLSEIEEVFKSSSSLRSLEIENCGRLTSVIPALEHLTALESLSLGGIPVVDEEFEDDMPWRFLRHNLRSLELRSLDALRMLPRGIKHLTALEKLSITDCKWLKALPEWIGCLSSLQSLTIKHCDNLKSLGGIQSITSLQKLVIYECVYLEETCEEPRGKEWPNIQHIPHISLGKYMLMHRH